MNKNKHKLIKRKALGGNLQKYEKKNTTGAALIGAGSGAISGAGMGSTFGPVGTAIGAVGGAIIGGVSGLTKANKLERDAKAAIEVRNKMVMENKRIADEAELLDYPTTGYNDYQGTYAANGKKLIKIKPENKGKFTAYAKSHGKSVQEMANDIMANKEDYNSTIIKRANFARNAAKWNKSQGGKLDVPNGKSLGNGAELVTSPNGSTTPMHGQPGGDIPVKQGGIKTGDVVEPGEIIQTTSNGDQYALSKRLGIAQKYMNLNNQLKDLQSKLKTTNRIEDQNAINREIEKIKMLMDNLPKEQEVIKEVNGLQDDSGAARYGRKLGNGNWLNNIFGKKDKEEDWYKSAQKEANSPYQSDESVGNNQGYVGGRRVNEQGYLIDEQGNEIDNSTGVAFKDDTSIPTKSSSTNLKSSLKNFNLQKAGKVAYALTPMVDNLVNAYMTSRTPKIPEPVLDIHKNLNTDVNINSQLNRINKGIVSNQKEIDTNVSNRAVAQVLKQKAQSEGLEQKGELQSRADEIRRDIVNRNREMADMTTASNTGKINQFNKEVAARQAGIQQDISQNVSNLESDIYRAQERKDMKEYQDKQLQIQQLIYEDTGIFDRNFNPILAGVLPTDSDEEVTTKLKERFPNSDEETINAYLKLRKRNIK